MKALDPGHGRPDVREQIAGGAMAGFLKNYVKAFERSSEDNPPPAGFKFDPTLVLSYLRADDIPVYDYLARSFQVCDRWFGSVPGPTWPNRLYAVAGQSGGTTSNRRPPIYDLATFVRKLDTDDVSWRWYSHDPGTLRGIDGRYRLGHDDEFAYFARKTLFERRSFLDDARDGRLPAVSWIDPNFVDFRLFGPPGSNDDHPPSPMMAGQELVLTLIESVMRSPAWKKSLIVITYDEHGGLGTMSTRGSWPAPDDRRLMRRYGVRVPALVVSPYVERGAWHVVYDHTSIIKTILLRFCKRPDTVAKSMRGRAWPPPTTSAPCSRGRPTARAVAHRPGSYRARREGGRLAARDLPGDDARRDRAGRGRRGGPGADRPAGGGRGHVQAAAGRRASSRESPEVIGHQRCCARGYRRASLVNQESPAKTAARARLPARRARGGRKSGGTLARRESQASLTVGGRMPGTPSGAA